LSVSPLRFPAFLARRIGARISVTVGLERFRFEGPALYGYAACESATALRMGPDSRFTAMGDEALDPATPGVLIRLFETPPRVVGVWAEEGLLVQYCQYHLMLVGSDSALHLYLDIGPVVTVRDAHALRSFFRGHEITVLDRVFRAAGASAVQFVP
jgi:hypothetical protein